ncbi:MAG: EpsG family protein [Clostridia bacterium]|nr:EpsG family protein [Clostridia bacterium]
MFSEFNSWLFYLGIFSGSSYLLGLISQSQKKKTFFYVVMTTMALALPILMAAYRSCGTDSLTYMSSYMRISRMSWADVWESIDSFFESGHRLFVKFLGVFHSVRIYFGAYAAITLICLFVATKYYKGTAIALPMFLLYFLLFISSFNGMRQNFAAAIVALAFKYIFKRDFVKYVLLIILATMFHTSALLMVFLYFLWQKEDKLLPWPILFFIMLVFTIVCLNLDSVLGAFADHQFESDSLQRYVNYTDNTFEAKNRDFYLKLLVAGVVAWHHPRLAKIDKRNSFFAYLVYISTIIGLAGFINPTAKRFALYFSIASVWVLADIPKCYKDHHSIWVARLLVMLYAVARFTIVAYVLGQSHLIPYIWILPSWAQ